MTHHCYIITGITVSFYVYTFKVDLICILQSRSEGRSDPDPSTWTNMAIRSDGRQ